jgi:hypothetical protein
MALKKIVSGGQTGVDRGALDAALVAGFKCGGWCPAGRTSEDGDIPERYPLTPLPSVIAQRRIRLRGKLQNGIGRGRSRMSKTAMGR